MRTRQLGPIVLSICLLACASDPPIPMPLDASAPGADEQEIERAPVASRTVSPDIADADADGVSDELDSCAETSPARVVDDQGCDLFAGKLEGVEFAPDAYALNNQAREALDKLIFHLTTHAQVVLAVTGHTDNRGNARDNLELSKKRVLAVVRYLVVNGIDGRRLQPYGYGESRPVFSNASEEGRSHNRRIEINQVLPE